MGRESAGCRRTIVTSKFRAFRRLTAIALGSLLLSGVAVAQETFYYGVENDPERSDSADSARDAVKDATATKGQLPIKQDRTGEQILADLDKMVADFGANGKLKCENGIFVFHYSGHGGQVVQDGKLRSFFGTAKGVITADQLLDKLLAIVPECCTVLMLIDSCGSGNFVNSIDDKVDNDPNNPNGKRLSYYGVFGSAPGDINAPNECPRTNDDIGRHVKDGLSKGADGKHKADRDGDGKVTVKELAEFILGQQGTGFTSKFDRFDFVGETPHLDYDLTGNPIKNGREPGNPPVELPRDNQGRSGGSSINYDAIEQLLSFTGHRMVDTGFAGDPILNADVLIPAFELDGALSDGDFLFQSLDEFFEIRSGDDVYFRARLPFLTYRAESNDFYSPMIEVAMAGADPIHPFYDPSLAAIDSPWLGQFLDLFDPSSANFDPLRDLYFTYTPRDNLSALTFDFLADGTSDGEDGVFGSHSVPEPGTAVLLLVGLGMLAGARRRQRGAPKKTRAPAEGF